MPHTTAPEGFDDLPVEEQIAYVEQLWDRISATPEKIPTPGWHREVVRERLAAHRAAPDEVLSWETERRRIADRLDKKRG